MILFKFQESHVYKNHCKIGPGQTKGPLSFDFDVNLEGVILDCVELSLFYGRKKIQISC